MILSYEHIPQLDAPLTHVERSQMRFGRICVASFFIFSMLMIIGPASALKYAYPVLGVAIAVLLQFMAPAHYIVFVWLIWFFTPFFRRLVDFRTGGWDTTNQMMLTPYLVTLAGILSAFLSRIDWNRSDIRAFMLVALGIAYGAMVGIARNDTRGVIYDIFEWGSPAVLGFYILSQQQNARSLIRGVERTFLLSAILFASYGFYQYAFSKPPWDLMWENDSGYTSESAQEVFGARIYGTLNSPGPFALMCMASVALLITLRSRIRFIALPIAIVGLLISLVRSAWGALIAAIVWQMLFARKKDRIVALVLLVFGAIGVTVMLIWSGNYEFVLARFNSVKQVAAGEDGSAQARAEFTAIIATDALINPIGFGLGSTGMAAKFSNGVPMVFDNGVLNIMYVLGWIGTLPYAMGVFMIVYVMWKSSPQQPKFFIVGYQSIAVGLLCTVVFGNSLAGNAGCLIWSFLCLSIVASKLKWSRTNYADVVYVRRSVEQANAAERERQKQESVVPGDLPLPKPRGPRHRGSTVRYHEEPAPGQPAGDAAPASERAGGSRDADSPEKVTHA